MSQSISSSDHPIRIAMWSGPRNISTAMMRSFGARADCHVVDEPFYAAFPSETGLIHPMNTDALKEAKAANENSLYTSLLTPPPLSAISAPPDHPCAEPLPWPPS